MRDNLYNQISYILIHVSFSIIYRCTDFDLDQQWGRPQNIDCFSWMQIIRMVTHTHFGFACKSSRVCSIAT